MVRDGNSWCWYSFSAFAWLGGTGKLCERATVDPIDLIGDSLAKLGGRNSCWNVQIIPFCVFVRAIPRMLLFACYTRKTCVDVFFLSAFFWAGRCTVWLNKSSQCHESTTQCRSQSFTVSVALRGWSSLSSWKSLIANDKHQTLRTLRMTSKWLCTWSEPCPSRTAVLKDLADSDPKVSLQRHQRHPHLCIVLRSLSATWKL